MSAKNTSPNLTSPSSVTVYHVGPEDQDLRALAHILERADWNMCPGTRWNIAAAEDIPSAAVKSRGEAAAIVLCDRESKNGNWKDVLDAVGQFQAPPLLIIASRTADEYLWAEALNLGAYDVLSKPYHPAEVIRVLSMAWLHWTHRGASARLARAS